MKKISLLCALTMLSGVAMADGMAGSWYGKAAVTPTVSLNMVVNVDSLDPPAVTFDSPDQGAFGIPCGVRFLDSDSIAADIPAIGFSISGRRDGGTLHMRWSQGPHSGTLDMTQTPPEVRRPQTPQPPFPYSEREVSFTNPGDGAVLAGTLTLPDGAGGSTPVVLMVSGSGLQDRDESLFGHRPFAVLADRLARAGVASLRYDDRGAGKSTGDVTEATTYDFAADAAAGVAMLRGAGLGRVGVLGHSEGGMIAFMLAADPETAPDFIITMGAPALPGDSVLYDQTLRALRGAGVPEETAMAQSRAVVDKNRGGNAWIRTFLDMDPASWIRRLGCPALVLYGGLDFQVSPEINAAPMRGMAPGADVRVYDGLNHLMQHAVTGMVDEYGKIEETISEDVLNDIVSWSRSF